MRWLNGKAYTTRVMQTRLKSKLYSGINVGSNPTLTTKSNTMDKGKQIAKDLIDKMFEIAGHDVRYEDVIDRKDAWYQEYTMTEQQSQEWREWGEEYLRKTKKWSKASCRKEMAMIDLYCGLKTVPENHS